MACCMTRLQATTHFVTFLAADLCTYLLPLPWAGAGPPHCRCHLKALGAAASHASCKPTCTASITTLPSPLRHMLAAALWSEPCWALFHTALPSLCACQTPIGHVVFVFGAGNAGKRRDNLHM